MSPADPPPPYGPPGEGARDRDRTLARLVTWALEEDVGAGDATTRLTVAADQRGTAVIVAREELVLAGTEAARRVFEAVDGELQVEARAREGSLLGRGDEALALEGRLASILTGERAALNFLGRLSGIATLARRFAEAVEGTGARVLDTRKTTPGWRVLEKEAVALGGGFNHRMGLDDFILVKDNHIVAAGGVAEAVRRVRAGNTAALLVEVEVGDEAQLEEALEAGVERLLLDNLPIERLRSAVRRVHAMGAGRPELEASGNVSLETVRAVAETGVDWISVGALTHSARWADLSLEVLG